MWESNNLESAAGDEPGGHEIDRPTGAPNGVPATPAPPVPWQGPVLRGVATPRVFSALASAAGTPVPHRSSNGFSAPENGVHASANGHDGPADGGVEGGDAHADAGDEAGYDEDGGDDADEMWSAEAVAARRRAQQRWAEIQPGAVLPSLTLTEEEAAALLPPEPQYVPDALAALPLIEAPSHPTAPWLPAAPAGLAAPVMVTPFGPPGKRRSPAMVVLLSVVSLGFYALWWHHRVNREMSEFDSRMSVDAGRSTWAVAVPLIIGWLIAAGAGARYLLALGGTPTADLPISATQSLLLAFAPLVVPYLELLLPFSAAAVLMTHERARIVEDRIDIPADRQLRPTDALAWLSVPVVGGLVGMARMQRHLNEVWRAVSH